jgi:hypothetical protein
MSGKHEMTLLVQWECSCGAEGQMDCTSELEAETEWENHVEEAEADA